MAAVRPARRLLAWLHAWIGALAAVFVLMIALTGLAIAFAGALFEWQYPEILSLSSAPRNEAATIVPDVDAMLAATVEGYGRPIQILGLLMPGSRIDVDAAMFYGVQAGSDEIVMLGVDPATARYTGDFHLHDAFGHDLIDLHANLLAGEAGAVFVSVLGLLLAAFALTGLYLWWPRGRAAWSKLIDLRIGRLNVRGLFKLHGLAGIWTALLILYFALTGTMVAKPDWFGPLLDASHRALPVQTAPAFARRCGGAVTPNEAVQAVAPAFPGRQLAAVEFPGDDKAYRLRFKGAGDRDQYEGDGIAWVHSQCANTATTIDLAEMPAATQADAMMFSLHAGRTFGWIGTALVYITCAMLAVLSISGLLVWWRQYGPRRATAPSRKYASRSRPPSVEAKP